MKRVGQIFREGLVNRIKQGIDQNSNVFLISYSQVPSFQLGEFRKKLKQAGADVYVSKNSIAQIALKDLRQEELIEKVTGQMAFVWGNADSVALAKAMVEFTKGCENIKIQGGLLSGRILTKSDIVKLSELPSKDVLLSMLFATIQSPLTRLAGAFNAKTRELLSVLKQLSEKKGGN